MERSYKNGPKAANAAKPGGGICHLCCAGKPSYDFENLHLSLIPDDFFEVDIAIEMNVFSGHPNSQPSRSRTAAYVKTFYKEAPWREEPLFTRVLMHEPDKKEAFHKPDLFHCVNMGVGKTFAASSCVILLQLCPGNNADERVRQLSSWYIQYCKENGKTNYVQQITRDTLGWKTGNQDPQGAWNKGELTTCLCQFLEWFCSFQDVESSSDERMRLIGSASRALNLFMRLLYAADLWIPASEALRIAKAGRHFLDAYSRLARLSHAAGELRYAMIPKIHMVWHVVENIYGQAEKHPVVENPMAEAVAVDEDFIGRYCALTRSVSARQRILRSLERYLTQVLLLWEGV